MPNKDPKKRAAYDTAYRAAHKRERAAQNATYETKHRVELLAYRAARREERRACSGAWYRANRNRVLILCKAYHAAHREERCAHKVDMRKAHKAAKSSALFFAALQFASQQQKGKDNGQQATRNP